MKGMNVENAISKRYVKWWKAGINRMKSSILWEYSGYVLAFFGLKYVKQLIICQ